MKTVISIVMGALAGGLLVFLIMSSKATVKPLDLTAERTKAGIAVQLQRLDKITMASATAEQMAEMNDKQTIVVRGKTTAGFDFSKITPDDVSVEEDGSVLIQVPPPEIFKTEADGKSTKIYNPKTKQFDVRDSVLSPALKSVSEKAAQAGACQAGILTTATENMETMMQSYLKALGFKGVATRTPPGKCF